MAKGKVYFIGTPIGNLGDISERMISSLNEADIIFCEDTRVSGILLNYLNIKKKLVSNHSYNEEKNIEKIMTLLEEGQTVCVMSDAGNPLISDPGGKIVRTLIEHNYHFTFIPGPSALILALQGSGFDTSSFYFHGFLKDKLEKELTQLKDVKCSLIFYVGKSKINSTLEAILNVFGDRQVVIARELTKMYQTYHRGKVSELKDIEYKGELVLVVEGNKEIEESDYQTLIDDLVKVNLKDKEIVEIVHKHFKINKNKIKDYLLSLKDN